MPGKSKPSCQRASRSCSVSCRGTWLKFKFSGLWGRGILDLKFKGWDLVFRTKGHWSKVSKFGFTAWGLGLASHKMPTNKSPNEDQPQEGSYQLREVL